MDSIRNIISGKKGLIVGIANENSIAYGCASVLRELGAEVTVTFAPAVLVAAPANESVIVAFWLLAAAAVRNAIAAWRAQQAS